MARSKPHPKNVPGDFYVEDGCCTMCQIPLREAPDLFGGFGVAEDGRHCYVKRQPQTRTEFDGMIMAIRGAEAECIRYRGTDRMIQTRLAEIGELIVCDELLPDFKQQVEQEFERVRLLNESH